MTVPSTTSAISYVGTGTTPILPYTWQISQASDLVVYTWLPASGVITTLLLNTNYTVDGVGIQTGGNVTLLAGNLAVGTTCFIASDPAEVQLLLLQQGAAFNPADLMNALDYLTREVQATRRVASNSLQIPLVESLNGVTTVLPAYAQRANKYLGFDASGIPTLITSPVTTAGSIAASVVVQMVATMTALKNLSALVAGQIFTLQGFFAVGDGGSGSYVWNAADTRTDDGGTIIQLTAGGTGRFNLLPGPQVNVANFGVLGTGADESTRFNLATTWLTAVPGRELHCDGNKSYVIGTRLVMTGGTTFKWYGHGCTIKAINAMSAAAGNQLVQFLTCTDGLIQDFVFDGNRANRTFVGQVPAHNIDIYTSNARLKFVNVRSDNAIIDGFFVASGTPTVLASIPTDIQLWYCSATNAYRNNVSVVDSNRFREIGGRYTSAIGGVAPQAGIDFEPDLNTNQGNIDAVCIGTECSDNAGAGFQVTLSNTHVKLYDCRSNRNTRSAIEGSYGSLIVDGFYGEGYTTSAIRGIIDCSSGSGRTTLRNITLKDIKTGTGNKPCIYVHVTNTGPVEIENFEGYDLNTSLIVAYVRVVINGMKGASWTAGVTAVDLESTAVRSVIRNVSLDMTTAFATRGLYCVAPDVLVDGFTVLNPGMTFNGALLWDVGATAPIIKNVHVLQDTAIPAGQTALYLQAGVVAKFIDNVTARCTGADYTAAQVATFTTAQTGYIGNVSPYPYAGSAVYDPPSLADGAGATTAVTVTGAVLGDRCQASFSLDLQGILVTAYVSAANTVTARFQNETGGVLDLASGTLRAWIDKRN